MTAADADPRAVAAVVAALLAQGERIDALSRLLTLAGLAGVAWAAGGPSPAAAVACAGAAAAGLAQLWLAVRVGLDARLFRLLAREPDLARLDAAMAAAGLVGADAGGARPLAERAAGARRLLARQGALAAVQAVLLAAAGIAA